MTTEEFKQYEKLFSINGSSLSVPRLPETIRGIIEDVLEKLLPNVPIDYLPLALNAKLAHMVSSARVTVETLDQTFVPINFYGITFMRSGSGKDKTIKYIDRFILNKFKDKFREASRIYIAQRTHEVEQEAEEKYETAKGERDKYKQLHAPREFKFEFSGSSTLQGLTADRLELQKAGFGSTFLKVSEFGQYIKGDTTAKREFVAEMIDIFDDGSSTGGAIQGKSFNTSVEGVPSNALFHTSYSGLQEGEGRAKLLEMFNTGLARRSFICFPSNNDYIPSSISLKEELEKDEQDKQTAIEGSKEYSDYLGYVYENIFKSSTTVKPSVRFSKKAKNLLFAYRKICEARASDYYSTMSDEGYPADVLNRPYKANKLAGLIAVIEHCDTLEIKEEDILAAIYQVEFYGQHLKKFYINESMDDVEHIFNLMRNRAGREVKRGDIRSLNLVHKDEFRSWFEEILPEVHRYAKGKGYIIELSGSGQLAKYKLTKK